MAFCSSVVKISSFSEKIRSIKNDDTPKCRVGGIPEHVFGFKPRSVSLKNSNSRRKKSHSTIVFSFNKNDLIQDGLGMDFEKVSSNTSYFNPGVDSRTFDESSPQEADAATLSSEQDSESSSNLDFIENVSTINIHPSELKEIQDYVPDTDMDQLVESINSIDFQKDDLLKQVSNFTQKLSETARKLSSRTQSARLETAKLKKISRLHQAEEIKRMEDLRRIVDLRRMEERKLEGIRVEKKRLVQFLSNSNLKLETESLNQVNGNMNETSSQIISNSDQTGVSSLLEASGSDISLPNGIVISSSTSSSSSLSLDFTESNTSVTQKNTTNHPKTLKNGFETEESFSFSIPDSLQTTPELKPNQESQTRSNSNTQSISYQDTNECNITHPGALSCTKTSIKKDEEKRTAVVTMETTVQCAGEACLLHSLDLDDYVELAMQSLVETAQGLRRTRFQRSTDSDPYVREKHKAIVDILTFGKICSSKPIDPPSKFGHESFILELLDEKTGRKTTALFKPRIEGDAEGWHRASIEWVAYELNLMLGMDYIPPVVYRKNGVNIMGSHFQEGAFIHWVDDAKPLRKVPAANWGISVARVLSDTRVLDVLLNNSDRHHGHFLFGEHWTDSNAKHPILIDHAAGFRKEAVVNMEHENAFQTGSVKCVSAKTYLRIRFLDKLVMFEKFKNFLSDLEIEEMMRRRDMILSYLDKLVQERGYHRTVIE